MINRLFLFLSIAFLAVSCSEKAEISTQTDDFFHLEEEGAFLPLWVRGNTSSGKILLYVQGGPGLNTLDLATVDYLGWKDGLEKDYAVAYYDQRGTGNAQGEFDWESISIEQYLKDLHKVVLLLKHQYPDNEVYLLGHSFGGWLGYLYALEYQNQSPVSGIIAANAPFTTDKNEVRWIFRQQFLINVAQEFVEQGHQPEFWTEVLQWTEENPQIETREQRRQWNRYVIEGLSAYEVEVPISVGKIIEGVFFSSLNIFPSLLSVERLDKLADLLFEDEEGIDVLSRVSELNTPLLMITGRYDDIAPPEEFYYAFDQIGSTQKKLVVLPDAGHESFLNQPELFREAVKEFVR